MEFTKFEETYYSVNDLKITTANDVTKFFQMMKADTGRRSCKDWAKMYYGTASRDDYNYQANIAKVSSMIQHLKAGGFVKCESVETTPFVETIPLYAYINLETHEVIPCTIEAKDKDGFVYEVPNAKVQELRRKGMFGYEQIGEKTVKHRKFINLYFA